MNYDKESKIFFDEIKHHQKEILINENNVLNYDKLNDGSNKTILNKIKHHLNEISKHKQSISDLEYLLHSKLILNYVQVGSCLCIVSDDQKYYSLIDVIKQKYSIKKVFKKICVLESKNGSDKYFMNEKYYDNFKENNIINNLPSSYKKNVMNCPNYSLIINNITNVHFNYEQVLKYFTMLDSKRIVFNDEKFYNNSGFSYNTLYEIELPVYYIIDTDNETNFDCEKIHLLCYVNNNNFCKLNSSIE